MRKKPIFTKTLSLFLSLLMAFSVFGILKIDVFAAGSATDAQWNALADALRSENVANAAFHGTNSVTVEDPSGDVYNAATAYYAVLNSYIATASSGSESNYNSSYRLSSQVRDIVKTQMQQRMGSADYTKYNVADVITYLGGNVTLSSANNTNQNSVSSSSTVTVTVTRTSNLMNYATLDEVTSVPTYSYTVTHTRRSYSVTSGSGCNQTTTTYYYLSASDVTTSTSTSSVDISLLTAFRTALNDNASTLNKSQAAQIDLGFDTLSDAYNTVKTAKENAEAKFGETIVGHFFAEAWYAKISALEASMKIAEYVPVVNNINDDVATDISDFSRAQLTEIYERLKANYDSYKAINIPAVYTYFETDNSILVRSVVDAKFTEIETAYEIATLREVVKPAVDEDIALYQTYDDDWVLATDNADETIDAALAAIEGYVATLTNDYHAENVALVFGDNFYTDVVNPLRIELNRLLEVNEYKVAFAGYKSVYQTAFEPVSDSYSTDQLYSVLSARDAWYTDLQAFVAEVNEYDAELAAKIFTTLEAAMEEKIDSVYAMLNARVESTINNAYDLYQGFVAVYGYTIDTQDDVNVNNYTSLQSAIGLLNPLHYEFICNTDHFDVSEETVAKYEEIKNAVFAFVNYDATKGLSAYTYNKEYIAEYLRMVSAGDVARNADYEVSDEKVEAIIDILENVLASDTVKESFDLSGTVTGILDNLYTDDFLNTLIQYVYPMVTFEFAKVWADLPTEMNGVPTGNSMAPTANLTLNIDNMPTALNKLDLDLLPKLLAANVSQTQYPDAYNKLNAVPNSVSAVQTNGEWVWGTNPWENANIYDAETGKLTLEWGITDKESFLQAASQALSGVAPLLLAVLSNVTTTKDGSIGTGSGNSPDCSMVTITVTAIKLYMTFGGNPGYNNMLAPILTVLGANDLPDGNSLDTIRKVLEDGVIGPFEQILTKLADHPLDTILKILPSLAFAMNLNLVQPLMNELKTNIAYKADAEYTYKASIFASGSGTSEDAMSDSLDINLGEMINLADMGIDITSMNGLVNSILTLLNKSDEEAEEGEEPAAPALSLPEINSARLAMLGTDVEWIPGNRTVSPYSAFEGHESDYVRILVDNRADVFLDVLDYLVRAIDQNDLLTSVIDLLNSKKTEEEEQIELSEAILGIVDNFVQNENDCIAAITELIFPQRYEMPAGIEWITEGNINETDYAEFWTEDNTDLTGTDWTREDALFVKGHLEDILTIVVKLLGDTVGNAQTLSEAVQYFAGSLFTADTVNGIAEALGGLLSGLELPEAIAEMDLFGQLGLDPYAWDGMVFEFEDGDEEAFKNALITVLDPLAPLLQFLLAETDLELTLLDAVPVKALGYDGYSYGIVPLLEALGCTGVLTTEEFQADKANIVANIVNPLFTAIDALIADPLGFVGEIVPSAIYFDMVDAIRVAFEHLLFGVDVLLDTIRPIYDINIRNLLGSQLDFDLGTLASDPLKFIMTKVSEIVSEKAGIDLMIDYSIDSLKGTLHFTTPERFDSANGDDAYTIHLSEDGKAELMVRVLDYVMDQINTGDNAQKLTDLVTGFIGSEGASELVDTILGNFVNNYPDSVVALVKLLFPERQDIDPIRIEWITENIGAASYSAYWTDSAAPDTEWNREKAAYIDSHLEEVLNDAIKLLSDKLGGATTLSGAAQYLVSSLLTADNANALVAKINELIGGLGLPDAVYDILASFGIDISVWSDMSFDFANGDADAFKAALVDILDPLAPVLRFVLIEGGDLTGTVLDAIPLTLMGYDGYSWGIVPLLEALGCTGIKSTAEFAADGEHVVANILDPLFTLVDQITANPLAVVKRLIPALIYFDKVDGIQVAVQNLLLSVNVILDTARPLYDIDLLALIAEKTGIDLADTETSFLQTILDMIPGLLGDTLGDLTINMFRIDDLTAKVHFTDPARFDSKNGEDGYTNTLTEDGELELLVAVLDYAVEDVLFEEGNREVINGMIDDAMGEGASSGIVGEILNNFETNYPESLLAIFRLLFPERVAMTAPKINWITDSNIGADPTYIGTEVPDGEHTLWTTEKAVYMAEHLGDVLNDIVAIFSEQLGGAENLDDAVSFLAKDIFTAENANKIAGALKNLVTNFGLSDSIIDIIKAFDVDLTAWDNMSFSFADGDRTAFKNALITTLKPLAPVLRFILIEGGDLEGEVLGAFPVKLLGYDGYSYGLVPLMEALGCTGVKTTSAFKADKDHVVENIVNPLFTAVDHLVADPLNFIVEVLPALLYFDKVGAVPVAVENLLFSVNVVLDTIRPLYDIDIYALVEEKTGIDLHFEDEDPIEVLIQKLVELVEEKTGVDFELDLSVDNLCETLHFTDPEKFTSANGDDAYTIHLTDEGKADLLSHTLDYAVNEVIFEYNFDSFVELIDQYIDDPDTRGIVVGILNIMKSADKDMADFHDVHDVALASLFWVFFGADSVTDATADFLYRYRNGEWYEIIFTVTDKAPDYVDKAAFMLTEAYTVEYPAFQKVMEERKELLKPIYEYTDEEVQEVAGIGARLIRFFAIIVAFFKKLFNR